ncbi:Cadherin-5 [Heterocephalus glaber]|uniref:Cadherin-5 n=1 Tax=Heterocephalus glaber TaxID=10181 RepID=G5BDG3_HETGA|nr:Cadherin-5 [Heterocephalus glaber]
MSLTLLSYLVLTLASALGSLTLLCVKVHLDMSICEGETNVADDSGHSDNPRTMRNYVDEDFVPLGMSSAGVTLPWSITASWDRGLPGCYGGPAECKKPVFIAAETQCATPEPVIEPELKTSSAPPCTIPVRTAGKANDEAEAEADPGQDEAAAMMGAYAKVFTAVGIMMSVADTLTIIHNQHTSTLAPRKNWFSFCMAKSWNTKTTREMTDKMMGRIMKACTVLRTSSFPYDRLVLPRKKQRLTMLTTALGTYMGLLVAASVAGCDPTQLDTLSLPCIHRRQKRDWIWNQMHVDEEKTDPLPYYVGKLKSSVNRKNATYVLKGEAANSIFQVNADTGDVYAFARLDREKVSEYSLVALIVDKDTNKNLEPPSNFTIKVHDINDNWPVFTHRLFNASVLEMSPGGTSVMRLTAVDADDPTVADHATVMYQILKGGENFAIDNSGLISTAKQNLDREVQASYEIVVEARDAEGLQGESGTATVLITLQDVNDNFPIFAQPAMYTFVVPEDIRVGSSVGSLFVEDPDEPQNRKTKFDIVQGEYRDTFTIDTDPTRNEGIIKPMKPLDYELIQKYSFVVEATDPTINLGYLRGITGKNKARVVINILDVDEPPVFQKRFYHFLLNENQKKNLIGSVLAKDPDKAGRNIGYSIRKTSDKGQFFRITKQGDIHCEKELDREIYPWHNLTVEANELDPNGNPTGKESIVQVHIEVLDENDNAPEFAQPYEPKVCENAAQGKLVVQISAVDKDITPQNVKFKFALGTDDSNFTLIDNHDNTANITVKYGPFDREHAKFYYLPVLISDNGSPSLTGTSTLTVVVCKCNQQGTFTFCEEAVAQAGVSIQALVAIFLCILTITGLLGQKIRTQIAPLY